MKLAKAIQLMGGNSPGIDPALMERDVVSFVIDSRDVKAGDVFFALSQPEYRNNGFNGDFDDATVYVRSSLEKGAVAAVVRQDRFEEYQTELASIEDKLIFVDDVIVALQALAHAVYLEWNRPVVAITGSAGKTTAKELTAHVLEASGRKVLKNIKNYNNGLGHPLTVLNLAKDALFDIAVLEMGMSTPQHEIERLCRITPPDISVVLNVLPVHIEHLGTIERIQQAKAEIVEGMKVGGIAVLNADDHRVAEMSALSRGSAVTFGIDNQADVMARDIDFEGFGTTSFALITKVGEERVSFPLNGRHNIMNSLAAAAVGYSLGMSVEQIGRALASVESPPQRGEILRFAAGFTVINDSYNSNPDALLSMVQTLVEGSEGAKRRVVVAGEMLELGDDAQRLHIETGEKIAASDVDILIGVRGLGRQLIDGAKEAGLKNAIFAEDSDAAGRLLVDEIKQGDVVLVKGSRGVRTEKVIEQLLDKFELEDKTAAAN